MRTGGRVLVRGKAAAELIVLDEPLSIWGGIDPATGAVIDERHPQHGEVVSGRILVMPHGRGSSSSPSVLAEAIRMGTAPVGIVLSQADPMLVIGSLVANRLYGAECPIVVAPIPEDPSGMWAIDGRGLRRLPGRSAGRPI